MLLFNVDYLNTHSLAFLNLSSERNTILFFFVSDLKIVKKNKLGFVLCKFCERHCTFPLGFLFRL